MKDFIMFFSILFIFYTYFGYPLLLWLIVLLKKKSSTPNAIFPSLTVMFAAYNEEDCITETIQSVLDSDYPKESFDIVVISDCSTDKTDEIVKSFNSEKVNLVRLPSRQGKTAALRAGLNHAKGEIIVLIDASSVFQQDTLKRLLRHFFDPKVGSVVGAKRILKTKNTISHGEGIYWKYDSMLRYLESLMGSSWVGCEGGISAIRKNLLKMDFPADFAEDYSICCRIFEQGYLNKYEPNAIIHEIASPNMEAEFSRKMRVIVRGMRAFFAFSYLMNPFIHFGFFFQNISHRLFRWLVPFFLIALYIASIKNTTPTGLFLFYSQSIFYALGLLGIIFKYLKLDIKMTAIPFYFITTNITALISWFCMFKKFGKWKPTPRKKLRKQIK